jgi:hypothetical protein
MQDARFRFQSDAGTGRFQSSMGGTIMQAKHGNAALVLWGHSGSWHRSNVKEEERKTVKGAGGETVNDKEKRKKNSQMIPWTPSSSV